MPKKLVAIYDEDEKLIVEYPIVLGGALGSDNDFVKAARRSALEDQLLTEDQMTRAKFVIRSSDV